MAVKHVPNLSAPLTSLCAGLGLLLCSFGAASAQGCDAKCEEQRKYFIPRLVHADAPTRAAAYNGICGLNYVGDLPIFIGGTQDPSPQVRAVAVRCLPKFNSPLAQQFLEEATKDEDKNVRQAAFDAMRHNPSDDNLEQLLAEFSTTTDCQRRAQIADSLSAYKDARMVAPILEQMRAPQSCPTAKFDAQLLAALPDDIQETFIPQMMASGDGAEIALAVRILALRPSNFGNAQLSALLESPDQAIKQRAMAALGSSGLPSAVDPLKAAFLDGQEDDRFAAALSLGLLQASVEVFAIITPLLTSESDLDRMAALTALGASDDPRSVAPIVQALQDPSADVRYTAVEWLVSLRPEEAIEPLGRLLTDEEEWLRDEAALALQRYKNPRAKALLAQHGR